jgi:hypothetical protein
MIRRVAGAALAAASLALLAASHGAAQSAPLPPCPPGTPAPPPPTVQATLAAVGSPARLVAGRPISIEYDDPNLVVGVQSTTGPPGTVVLDDIGDSVTLTVPAPGQVTMTADYYVVRNGTCTFPFTYTLGVTPGDLVPAGVGVTRGFSPRGGFSFAKLPRFGDFDQLKPSTGLVFRCDGAKAPVPLSLVLHAERRLARRPGPASPTVRLDVPDPCTTRTTRVVGLGVRLWFVNNDHPDEGERFFAVEVTTKAPTRFWAQFAQDARLLGSFRFYTAWKPQNGRFPSGWVIAPEAGFERARCRRPPPLTGLGFRPWKLPPCPRRPA